MPQIIQVTGANDADIQKRSAAFSKLNSLDTKVLERLAIVSDSPKGQNYFRNDMLFIGVKRFLGL